MLSRKKFVVFVAMAALVAGCGSSGGTDNPPTPPTPMAPPPPPPEPTFEERLADLAEYDPNPCRARTPGFEALGGWLKNDGRELSKSRVWIGDQGALTEDRHGAAVWGTFTECAVRSTEDQYAQDEDRYDDDGVLTYTVSIVYDKAREDGRDLIISSSSSPPYMDIELPEPDPGWIESRPVYNGERADGQRILDISGAGNGVGKRTGHLQTPLFQAYLDRHETALLIIVGGHAGDSDSRRLAGAHPETGVIGPQGTSICSDAEPLCLFGPWQGKDGTGTSHATPQVAAALDAAWAVWPDMDILDLRNLAFDCAENMDAREGDTTTERSYSYSNGRSFTSTPNSTWGHGILSLTCLFTPNGGLQNPVTGNAISGSIIGPLAGPVTGASITGVDYTGRDFGYGFARPVSRENLALAATANLRSVAATYGARAYRYGFGSVNGTLWQSGALRVDLTAAAAPGGGAGDAIGIAANWQVGNLTLRGGMATQPEGVGSLSGSRAFRAPSTLSGAISAAYAKALPFGLSVHVQADRWRTVATRSRSLWESADLAETRVGASLVKRAGRHEFSVQAAWQSGLTGELGVAGRTWPVAGVRESGLWLSWRRAEIR